MLESMVRSPKTEQGVSERARMVLLAADGRLTRIHCGGAWHLAKGGSADWRTRLRGGTALLGLSDRSKRPGATPIYTAETEPAASWRSWTMPPPDPKLRSLDGATAGPRRWAMCRTSTSGASCAGKRYDLARVRKSWCQSNDPEFVPKAAEIVGALLAPAGATPSCWRSDEKPHIQALERAQGYLKLPNGRALIGHGHVAYKRHGFDDADLPLSTFALRARFRHRTLRTAAPPLSVLDFMNRVVSRLSRPRDRMSFSTT